MPFIVAAEPIGKIVEEDDDVVLGVVLTDEGEIRFERNMRRIRELALAADAEAVGLRLT